VTVQGTSSGSQNITVTNSGSSTPVFNSPQTVLVLNGGSSLTVGNKGLVPQISNGLVNNFLMQGSPGSNAYVQTAFNDGPVSGVATGLLSTIDALATGFFLNASAIVSRPDNPEPNQIGGGPFARVTFGGANTNLGSNAVGFGQSTTSFTNGSTTYSGLQAGFDVGVYNINGSDWNVNLGFFGGVANAGTYSTTDVTRRDTSSGVKQSPSFVATVANCPLTTSGALTFTGMGCCFSSLGAAIYDSPPKPDRVRCLIARRRRCPWTKRWLVVTKRRLFFARNVQGLAGLVRCTRQGPKLRTCPAADPAEWSTRVGHRADADQYGSDEGYPRAALRVAPGQWRGAAARE
jgi:hypothetical protein